jgi:hypothetical protein
MANTKISALPLASTPLAGTEVLPIVQGGITEQVATNDLTVRNIRANATTGILQVTGPAAASTRVMTVPDANFTAARTDAAQSFTGDQTLSTGNLVIGTSGKGIDFSITSHPAGMTSELLADYEEGTWTPTIGLAAASPTIVYTNQVGRYTKVGNRVFFSAFVTTSTWTHASTTNEFIMSLPIAPSTSPAQIASFNCALNFTKANYTQITPYITTAFWGSSVIFAANGSGQSFDGIVASNVPSGTNIVLVVAGHYAA